MSGDPSKPRFSIWFPLWILTVLGLAPFAVMYFLAQGPAAQDERMFTCSMHPQVLQKGPGICPICNMALEPLKAGGGTMGTGITIDPVVVQNMGLRLGTAVAAPLRATVHTVGTLVEPENARQDVNLKVGGFVEKLHADVQGMRVQKGDPLLELYSPELQLAQEELISARRMVDQLPTDASSARRAQVQDMLETARRKLELWNVDAAQIAEIEALPRSKHTVTFRSPLSGIVAARRVTQGTSVMAGQELLSIVDYGTLWLEAQAYERDIPALTVGLSGSATFLSFPGQVFTGKVVFVAPAMQDTTRTATVRIALDNKDMRLKPGMYARVTFEVAAVGDVVQVPREAVVDTGARQTLFVAEGAGRFAPRAVRMGRSGADGLVEIVEGLQAGEQIVVSGQFLLDSESRMREAVRKLSAEGVITTQPAPQRPARPTPAVDDATRARVDELLRAYLDFADELASDRFDAARLGRLQLLAAAFAAAPPAEVRDTAGLFASRVANTGRAPEGERRKVFAGASEALVELVHAIPPSPALAQQVFVVHCPMFPATWLQTSPEVRNPFYGASMLRCGDVKETIQPVASRPTSQPAGK